MQTLTVESLQNGSLVTITARVSWNREPRVSVQLSGGERLDKIELDSAEARGFARGLLALLEAAAADDLSVRGVM